MKDSSFGFRRSKVKVTVGPEYWKMHHLFLLTLYLENYWTEFHQTFHVEAFWDKDEFFNFWDQKV